ncbi:TetR/AcrR family transcriptional regulator [Streptomyces sp. NPDC004528]|uniref:TetR/AcrR family transcriptional regulator n=1 Tax=Streptomyces sp. NPDC004528 TaxID=3154550 RepID=UPI0033AF8770
MPTSTASRPSARERLLEAANELFYGEGVQTVGIDRVIEHAGVAKASLYNAFGSKEGLVCAYLDLRYLRMRDRITTVLARFDGPREKLLGVFDALGEAISDPGYNGCAFVRATAETDEDSSIRQVADTYRLWIRGLFTELAAACGYEAPERLARQLLLLYDGAGQSARMDHDLTAAATARAAAAVLLDTAPVTANTP